MDIDFRLALRPQLFQPADIFKGALRRVGFLIAGRKRVQIFGGKPISRAAVTLEDALLEGIGPGVDDAFDPSLKLRLGRIGKLCVRAPDHDVRAHHGAFGIVRRARLEAPAERVFEHLYDGNTDIGIEAFARHIDECRYEALELVAADENARAGREIELQHFIRDLRELLRRNLEQLVAREGLQHIQQRAFGMAALRVAGAAQHLAGLLPKDRDVERGVIVGAGGKQPRKPQVARDRSACPVKLDGGDVHMHPAVHRGLVVALCNDDGR